MKWISDTSKQLFLGVFLTSFFVGAVSGAVFGTLGASMMSFSLNKTLNRVLSASLFEPRSIDPFTTGTNKDGTNKEGAIVGDNNTSPSVVDAVRRIEPAVVSIVATKDVPKVSQIPLNNMFGDDFFKQFFGVPQVPQGSTGTEKRKVGGGTGFFITSDGLLLTNKHVVADEGADYSVLLNNGKELPAKVLARDSVNDLAIIKVDGSNFATVVFGDSNRLELGETVVAIGNALGEFRNTVSVGVISGLSRSITASGSPLGAEQLSGVIQTDTAINSGNSGGPLINLRGEVIGVNTAVSTQGQNIGFAIPSNEVKQVVESVKKFGRIVRPYLGVRYVLVDDAIAKDNNLPVSYGALVIHGERSTDLAVSPGSPADKAGIKENDIILKIGDEKISVDNPLVKIITKYNVNDKVTLTVLHQGEEKEVQVTLIERK